MLMNPFMRIIYWKIYLPWLKKQFPVSELAYKRLRKLKGIEIGASAQVDFKLNTLNVDMSYNTDKNNIYGQEQKKHAGRIAKVDVIAAGDNLPFEDNQWDFVINSHVLEHFYDPIKAINEWERVVKPGGYIFMIVPHKERTFDSPRPRTTLRELIERHEWTLQNPEVIKEDDHHSVWVTEDLVELCEYLGLNIVEHYDIDDSVGNGFTIVCRV